MTEVLLVRGADLEELHTAELKPALGTFMGGKFGSFMSGK